MPVSRVLSSAQIGYVPVQRRSSWLIEESSDGKIEPGVSNPGRVQRKAVRPMRARACIVRAVRAGFKVLGTK